MKEEVEKEEMEAKEKEEEQVMEEEEMRLEQAIKQKDEEREEGNSFRSRTNIESTQGLTQTQVLQVCQKVLFTFSEDLAATQAGNNYFCDGINTFTYLLVLHCGQASGYPGGFY